MDGAGFVLVGHVPTDTDRAHDLALIQIDPKKKLSSFLKLGDSDSLQVGQKVLAIGNPFGLAGTLTTGIVSSLHRKIQSEDRGVLVPFADAKAIAREVTELLRDETRRTAIRKNAYKLGREMVWSNVAGLYLRSFELARWTADLKSVRP